MSLFSIFKREQKPPTPEKLADLAPTDSGDSYDWGRTKRSVSNRAGDPSLKDAAIFRQRHLIDRDSRIGGGVYLGENKREALVVDWSPKKEQHRGPSPLTQLYKEALSRCHKGGIFDKRTALREVYDLVRETFKDNSDSGLDKVFSDSGIKPDDKVPIDLFIVTKTGVCRHMAITIGAILERMCDEGYLGGKVNIHRNQSSLGAHAWIRYTASDGKPYILDAMHGYIGSLAKSFTSQWNYFMPGENRN